MGHLVSQHRAYKDLQIRLDKTHIGLPEADGLYDLLKLLYTEEEARLATQMPVIPVKLEALAKRTRLPAAKLQKLLERMADVGTVMDVVHPKTGEVRYMLSPPAVGFVEFALMKRRDDIDQPSIAMAMDAYSRAGTLFTSPDGVPTQIGRALVHEDTLEEQTRTEILPYEKASDLIRESKRIGMASCYCRHEAEHMGRACDAPNDVCLALNQGVDYVVRHEFSREIDQAEALDALARSREAGLIHIADNVANKPIYLCNCCGCCCIQLRTINRYGVPNAVHTSNFIAAIDTSTCRGCGRCARRCPIQAIRLEPSPRDGKLKGTMHAVVDEDLCLGCGVCHAACRRDALHMDRRATRVVTPDDSLDRVLRMALDRGKLQHLLFDDGRGLPTKVAGIVNRTSKK